MRQPKRKRSERVAASPADGSDGAPVVLRLYVTGTTPRSSRAIEAIKRICETHLKGDYDLRIIDLYQEPAEAATAQILASPTLVRQTPLPLRRLVGDMTDESRVVKGLELRRDP